jgi:hypothetical protein
MRPPPAYQVYAADDLARSEYYGLSSGERGLLDSMQRAYWAEGSLLRDPKLLARALRLDETEVREYLTEAVLRHFESDESDPTRLHSKELQRQKLNYQVLRERQREGGRVGAAMTNRKHNREPYGSLASRPAGQPAGVELK